MYKYYLLQCLIVSTILLSSCGTSPKDVSSNPYYRDMIGKKICIKRHMLVVEWADEAAGRSEKEIFRLRNTMGKASDLDFSVYKRHHKNVAELDSWLNSVTPVPAGTSFTVSQINYYNAITSSDYIVKSTTEYPSLQNIPIEITSMFKALFEIEQREDKQLIDSAEYCN